MDCKKSQHQPNGKTDADFLDDQFGCQGQWTFITRLVKRQCPKQVNTIGPLIQVRSTAPATEL